MSNYDVKVLVNGRPVRQFRHKGKSFIEGRKGSNFELEFTNNTGTDVEIVPSVDGLSVMDGKTCSVKSNGYMVPAYGNIRIPGWRLDNDNVAEFVFKDQHKSYAAKTGKGTKGTGVIGFMVFKEYEYFSTQPITPIPFPRPINPWPPLEPYPWGPYRRWTTKTADDSGIFNISSTLDSHNMISGSSETVSDDSDDSAEESRRINISSSSLSAHNMAASASSVNVVSSDVEPFSLGVGFGDESTHNVEEVAFTRANPDHPEELITLYYDTRKGLERRGIQVVKKRKKKTEELPEAFPGYSNDGCKPPTGWKQRRR